MNTGHLRRLQRKQRKDNLVAKGVLDKDDRVIDLHNYHYALASDGTGKRMFLHPTKGFRIVDELFDGLRGGPIEKSVHINLINHNLAKKGIKFNVIYPFAHCQ